MSFQRRGRLWVPEAPFILPKGRTMEALLSHPPMLLSGHFTLELIDAKTQRVKRTLKFRNLITDAGLDYLGTNFVNNALSHMAAGTGNTAPVNGDTTLQAEIAPAATHRTNNTGSISDVYGYTSGGTDFHYRRVTRLFVEAQANGVLAELGWFSASTGGTMFARSLIKDAGGTPTTLTKTAADQLRVTYELRAYPPTADATIAGFVLDGTSHTITVRAINVGVSVSGWEQFLQVGAVGTGIKFAAESATLTARTSRPGLSSNSQSSSALQAYVGGNYYRDFQAIWEPGNANFATGIGMITGYTTASFYASDFGQCFQTSWSPKITKTSSKRLTLMFRRSWGRAP